MKRIEETLAELSVVSISGCWIWEGTTNQLGYGRIARRKNGKRVWILAHRASYETWRGPIPKGMVVCHTCDHRACVNPDHLFLGTQPDNLADMTAKGRAQRHLGGRPHRFSEEERRALLASGKPPEDIARDAGVHKATVYRWISDLCAQ